MNCHQCGGNMPEGAAFCALCGAKAGGVEAKMPPPLPSQKPKYYSSTDLFQRPGIVTLLAVLNFIGAAFYLIGAVVFFVMASKQPEDLVSFGVVGGFVFIFGIVHYACGRGLWNLKPYGRTLQIILACFGLLGFPVGTIVSILILVYFSKPQMKALFSGKSQAELSEAEREMLLQFSESSSGAAGVAIAIIAVGLVMVSMIGIIAAIAIPNLLTAIQRGKQKRTMADIRSIGTACEAFAVDHNAYPDAETMDDLARQVQPKYIPNLPVVDGWEHRFYYKATNPTTDGPQQYVILSAGKDGLLEHSNLEGYTQAATTSFNNDIVFSQGSFIQYPEGIQH